MDPKPLPRPPPDPSCAPPVEFFGACGAQLLGRALTGLRGASEARPLIFTALSRTKSQTPNLITIFYNQKCLRNAPKS